MNSINRVEIADGVFFSSVKDSRFKTMKITANIILPLSEETASENALLFGVLSRSCKAYPDFTALSKKLASLYGADLNISISKIGDRQVLSLSTNGIDDRYAFASESVARELSLLLCSVIFEPNVNDGKFVESEVEQERRQLFAAGTDFRFRHLPLFFPDHGPECFFIHFFPLFFLPVPGGTSGTTGKWRSGRGSPAGIPSRR